MLNEEARSLYWYFIPPNSTLYTKINSTTGKYYLANGFHLNCYNARFMSIAVIWVFILKGFHQQIKNLKHSNWISVWLSPVTGESIRRSTRTRRSEVKRTRDIIHRFHSVNWPIHLLNVWSFIWVENTYEFQVCRRRLLLSLMTPNSLRFTQSLISPLFRNSSFEQQIKR